MKRIFVVILLGTRGNRTELLVADEGNTTKSYHVAYLEER